MTARVSSGLANGAAPVRMARAKSVYRSTARFGSTGTVSSTNLIASLGYLRPALARRLFSRLGGSFFGSNQRRWNVSPSSWIAPHVLEVRHETQGLMDGQDAPAAPGRADDDRRLAAVERHGLFQNDVQSPPQRRQRHRLVKMRGRGDDDGIELGLLQHLRVVGEGAAFQLALRLRAPVGLGVGDGHEPKIGVPGQRDRVRAPADPAEARRGDAQRFLT